VRAGTDQPPSPSQTTSRSCTCPPYSPELNPVENVWAYLRANKLAITVFDTYDDIVNACCNPPCQQE